ncbi:MAG: response regulator, partial [Nitrospira sp.]|nr:response regulator [Nitrospira sp.]
MSSCTYCGYKLPLIIFLLTISIVAGTGFLTLRYIKSKFVESAGQTLATVATNIANKLDTLLNERYGDIQLLALGKAFREQDRATMTTYVLSMVESYPVYEWIGVTDKDGRIIISTDPSIVGQDRSDREWFRSVRDHGGIHIRPPRISPDSHGSMAIAFTAPIYNPAGQFIGAVTSRISMPVLEDSFRRALVALQGQWGTNTHLEYQFVRLNGDVIADSVLHEEGQSNLIKLEVLSARLAVSSPAGYVQEIHARLNKDVVTGYARSKGLNGEDTLQFGVLLRADYEDIAAPIQRTTFIIGIAALAMVLPLGLALIWTIRGLRQSIQTVTSEHERATAAEQKFRHIISSTPDAILIVNATGTIVLNNPRAETLFGYSPGTLLNQPMDILLPERFRARHKKHNQMFFDHPATRPMGAGLILSGRHQNGSEFSADVSLSFMDTPEGRFAIASIRDVTQQKQHEQELETAKIEALSSTKVKSEFLASMSHEIRTPLNAIIGTADLLWETPLSSEQRKYLRVFRRAGDTLLSLISDILDLSKIESGYMELDSITFNLEELIDKVMEMLTMQANEKGLEFAFHIDPEVPRYLLGDPVRLTQILVNLLGNALKFTEEGSVTLQVTKDGTNHLPGGIHFTITDTGIGIPTDKLEVIFERFRQVDSSRTRQYGGTGLGLAISKHLAERMHGRIWVESTVGKGSRFHCTVSLEVQPTTDIPKTVPVIELTGIKTLIVDDHSINRLILREMLADCHADLAEAVDGPTAISALRDAADQGKPFDLLLLDCRMPKMDGFQTVDHLKQASLDAGLTIVMLTSDDWANDIARTYDLSLGGYLIKPIRRADLIKTIAIAMGRSKETSLPAPQFPSGPDKVLPDSPLRILLAEDSPDNQLLIQSYLRETSHRLDVANDGSQAIEMFKRNRYDVILMDMQMPVMDGFTATETIRQWEEEHRLIPVPIIALTALA